MLLIIKTIVYSSELFKSAWDTSINLIQVLAYKPQLRKMMWLKLNRWKSAKTQVLLSPAGSSSPLHFSASLQLLSPCQIFLLRLFKSVIWAQEQGNYCVVSSKPFRSGMVFHCVHMCAQLPGTARCSPVETQRPQLWCFINSPTASKISLFLMLIRHTWIDRSGYQLLPN